MQRQLETKIPIPPPPQYKKQGHVKNQFMFIRTFLESQSTREEHTVFKSKSIREILKPEGE
jgi:hypothetical protein